MLFKKKQPADGANTKKKTTQLSLRQRISSLSRTQIIKIALISAGVLVVFLLGLYIYGETRNPSQPTEEQAYAQEFLGSDNSDETVSRLVGQYGEQYDQLYEKVTLSDPSQWNKETLDEAYVALLYADKIGAFNQVNTLLGFIDAADRTGLNVDNNSYDINQSMREAMQQSANESAQKQFEQATEGQQ